QPFAHGYLLYRLMYAALHPTTSAVDPKVGIAYYPHRTSRRTRPVASPSRRLIKEPIAGAHNGTQSSGTQSSGTQSSGTQSSGTQSSGTQSSGTQSSGTHRTVQSNRPS